MSPLGFGRISMLGRYAFIRPDPIARGELRLIFGLTIADDGG